MARLAWSTRSCITINHSLMTALSERSVDLDEMFRLFNGHLLNQFIATKPIGLALERLELSWPFDHPIIRKCLSLAALSVNCPNLEHLEMSL